MKGTSMRYNNSFMKNVLLLISDTKDNKKTNSNHIAATTSDTIITANKKTQTDMKSEYAFKEKLKNFKASFNRDTVNDIDDVDSDHLTTIKENQVIGADAVTHCTAAIDGLDNDDEQFITQLQPLHTVELQLSDGSEQMKMMQQINDDNNDSINLKLLWPPKQLQFNQSDVLPDNKKLSKMVHNNKMYQIIRDNNSFKGKNILNATDTFCDNYKNELNVAKSDKTASRRDVNARAATTTSSMAYDTTAKTKNSTMYDNRFKHEIEENIVAEKPTVNANNKLPLLSMSNDRTSLLSNESTSHITFDKLIELIDSEPKRIREWNAKSSINATSLLRLCGGGEQGINNGTTGWGSPPTAPSAAAGGSNANTSSWGSNQPSQQQWDQPSGSNAAVNVNVPNANVGQNSNMWPTAGNNQGSQPPHEQIQSASKAQGQPQQPQQASTQQPQPQPAAGSNNNNIAVSASVSNNPGNNNSASGLIGGGTSTTAAKNQLEQLTTMRDALFSQDGWGCQHVNQDTNWDVPGSPEPMAGGNIVKSDPSQSVAAAGAAAVPTTWKPNINNGTELWEANLRNGGQPPTPAVQKPWGHTPSTNLGGTWGEDDDGADSGVWATQSNAPAQQWNQPSGSNAAVNVNAANANVGQNSAMWPPAAAANPATTTAAALQPPQIVNPVLGGQDVRNVSGNQMDIRNADPRDMRGLSNGPHFNIPIAHTRDPTRELLREISRDVRGDLRGISGRLNGTSEMWGQHHNLTQGVNQQSAQQPQAQQSQQPQSQHGQMPMKTDKPPTGWEEPSPPTQRRNIQNFDDGTAIWAPSQQQPPQQSNQQQSSQQQQQQQVPLPQNRGWPKGGRSSWDEPVAGSGSTTPQLPQSRIIPSGIPSGIKQDGSMWNQAPNNAGRTSSWDEHSVVSGVNDKNAAINANSGGAWDSQTPSVWQQQQQQQAQQQQQQQKNKQLMGIDRNTSSKVSGVSSYRMLCDMGFKKEEIELALRAGNLNLDEAIDILNQSRSANINDAWRRHDDHNPNSGNFDHNNFQQRYPGGPQQAMPFQNNNPNLLNAIGVSGVSTNQGLNAIGNMQPMQAQKYLNQGAHNASGTGSGFNQGISQSLNAGNSNNTTPAAGQPSTQQLRMLVQQIQMAVQAGYLNHQILNQPLAPTTLVLLNQLLAHIKQLQVNQANMNRGINNIPMTLNISKLKQQIATLQNQIAQQQAAYVNKQPGGNHNMSGNVGIGAGIGIANIGNVANAGVGPSPNDYLRSQHDPINSLQNTFSDMSMTKEPPNSFQNSSGQQSRLNQWKLPNFDKEVGDNSTDFSRAPGTTSKSTMSTSNSVIGSLGLQDGTWSSGRSISDGWPDSTPDNDNKDWPSSQQSPAAAFTDLVPEFEPGKPWKGSQMKTIEDDPSITPGSVARSPLSISAAKDTDLFATSSKTSPTDIPPLSLSSSTWSFNPTGSSSQPHFTGSKGSNWSDGVSHQMGNQSELWSPPMTNKTARGPPPGLGNNKNLASANAITSTATSSSTNGWIGGNLRLSTGSWPSPWLLLKNMTAQIDGSTLRTLCMQHGPLQHFHLYLNHGIALCKYSTREEANKAQMALNNCVLGNTTICAESPCESEVQNILQHLGVPNNQQQPPPQQPQSQNPQQQQPQPGQQSSGTSLSSQWRPSSQTRSSNSDTWGSSVVWPSTNPTANFWAGLDAASTERGTPSNLSLLPENLLGNELN